MGYTIGGRKQLDERNKAIKEAFKSGITVHQLAEEYFLSGETIKRLCILNENKRVSFKYYFERDSLLCIYWIYRA